jgi:hypothetical protein
VCVHFVCLLFEKECGGSAGLEMTDIVLTMLMRWLCHAVHVQPAHTGPHVHPPLSAFCGAETLNVEKYPNLHMRAYYY